MEQGEVSIIGGATGSLDESSYGISAFQRIATGVTYGPADENFPIYLWGRRQRNLYGLAGVVP